MPEVATPPTPLRKRRSCRHVVLDDELWRRLDNAARKRGATAASLGSTLLAVALRDNLVDAIIDDGA
jgi:hypothetical protein